MTKTIQSKFSIVDIHEVLEERYQIAVVWSWEDVLAVRPDLTKDQAWEVLQDCKDAHDCNHGLTWDHLEASAAFLFPEAIERE